MRYAFDLDGTLCVTEQMDYLHATPIHTRIARVNELFHEGHHIIVHTARGQALTPSSRLRLFQQTRRQLLEWGLHFHELLPKPFAHVYVDDRGATPMEFFNDGA